ncbi:single-stranded DNA-binding protein [Borreliella burgdorferi]|uniref:Single-stranded DNA-binding protein n=3 Tax=Borreliella burgdorferi TaxID=139 RepID=SSB_BORBU|nr:single-stranded DNA-binding protein [Borreliella burgdorferi]O51141.1 RecName: Full=Single-stranded DNA-binding protein; Short=SSB [Borreliella burgdorferi B31]AGS66137.1 single-stranded DNA-binding protein [Borreliella burgdorferi CA382]AAC66492.1 single-stranded DNA-binding protein (SSB) (Helix-destabilizingprotein) [Borreliella burgdorferi B31]ACK74558.1 single-stranded DNA-binding protein (SSB) [Borreliella burgdorferi ZS7]ADQ30471.1 single-stranded DNA-binding protein (SSB) (Helix-dest
MADINSLVLSGRLTRDSELSYTESGMAVLRFSIANNRRMKKNDEWIDYPQYFDCVIFSKRAESLNDYLKKGKQVVVSGSLKYESWQDRNTGDKRSKVNIFVDNLQMFSSGSNTIQMQDSDVNSLTNHKKEDVVKDIDIVDDKFSEDIPF